MHEPSKPSVYGSESSAHSVELVGKFSPESSRTLSLCSQSLSEQKGLLESTQSRQILKQVKENSASLIVLRDSDSFCSSWATSTERISVLNRVFDFDGDIVSSKVYQGNMRALIRRMFRRRETTPRFTRLAFKNDEILEMWIWDEVSLQYKGSIQAVVNKGFENSLVHQSVVEDYQLMVLPSRPVCVENEREALAKDYYPFDDILDEVSEDYVRPRLRIDGKDGKVECDDVDFFVPSGNIWPVSPRHKMCDAILGESFLRRQREKLNMI